MEKSLEKVLLICLFVIAVFNSKIAINQPVLDQELLKLAGNYYGCAKWNDGICLECSRGFYFNNAGSCCQVPDQCMNFNTKQGKCDQCYEGYQMIDGKCVLRKIDGEKSKGCKKWKDNRCVECSYRYFMSPDSGICKQVDQNCRSWNEINGQCKQCYQGYKQMFGGCLIDANLNRPADNVLCKEWLGEICVNCISRAFFNQKLKCVAVSDQCRTWDKSNGFCLTCYKGYYQKKGVCLRDQSSNENIKDPGCALWDWDAQVCLRCSQRWYFNSKNKCVQVDSNCQKYNDKGVCLTCYKGYSNVNGVCQKQQFIELKDKGCAQWDWDNQYCLKCSPRWYFNKQGICIPLDPYCKNFGSEGVCSQCYRGYALEKGKCIIIERNIALEDPGCAKWQNGVCLACSFRWFFNSAGKCEQVDPLCKEFNSKGRCTSCYKGYDLLNGRCNKAIQPSFDLCKTWKGNVCTSCYPGYILYKGNCFDSNKILALLKGRVPNQCQECECSNSVQKY